MEFYIIYEEENHGPMPVEQLSDYGLTPESRVWSAGWANWKNAGDVPEIQEYLQRRQQQLIEEEKQRRIKAQQAKAEEEALQAQQAMQAQGMAQAQPIPPTQQYPPQPHATMPEQPAQPVAPQAPQPQQTYPQPPIPQQTASKWYMAINNTESGPFAENDLVSLGLTAESLVWTEGMVDWMPAGQVAALSHLLAAQPAPQPFQQPVAPSQPFADTPQYSAPASTADTTLKPSPWGLIALITSIVLLILGITVCAKISGYYYSPLATEYLQILSPAIISLVCSIIALSMESRGKSALRDAEFNSQQGLPTDTSINNAHKYYGMATGAGIIGFIWTALLIIGYIYTISGIS